MENKNILVAWVQEFVQRLASKSPTFFRVLQLIACVAGLLTGLPGLFAWVGINLPDWATGLQNKIVGISSVIVFIMAKLPIKSPAVATTNQGEVLTKTDASRFPFTAQAEQRDVAAALPRADPRSEIVNRLY